MNILFWEVRNRERRPQPLPRSRTSERVRKWLPDVTKREVDDRYALRDVEWKLFPELGRNALTRFGFRVSEDFQFMSALKMFEEGASIHAIYEACEPGKRSPKGERDAALARWRYATRPRRES